MPNEAEEEATSEEANNNKDNISPRGLGFRLTDLLDPAKPWVLVENGSLNGYFSWVPEQLRVGPWSVSAFVYLTLMWYLIAVAGCYLMGEDAQGWWAEPFETLEYPPAWSYECMYNIVATCWMIFVMYLVVIQGPLGIRAWTTYTIQAWTTLTLRHALCAAVSLTGHPKLVVAAELLRFPAACSTTVTFFIWNFVVAPIVYLVGMETPERKQLFLRFNFSFRLVQIHVFNIGFCLANIYWASPPRSLAASDLYLAALSIAVYMMWYLLILDRVGVHFYFIFSPRLNATPQIAVWTVLLATYLAAFALWWYLLLPPVVKEPEPSELAEDIASYAFSSVASLLPTGSADYIRNYWS